MMEIKPIKTQATKLMNDIERNSVVTFGLNTPQFIEINDETYIARPIDCYNWEIVLNDMKVIINPAMYDGDLIQIEVEGDLWIFYNTERVVLYNNTKQVFLGVVTEDLDPLTHEERIAKYFDKKERGEI